MGQPADVVPRLGPSRLVTLLLVDAAGSPVGALPELTVDFPFWPETESVQTAARDRFGVDITVVRLIDSGTGTGRTGGPVTYLAELHGPTSAAASQLAELTPQRSRQARAALAEDQPHRQWWARVGAVSEALRWADQQLAAGGRARTGPAVQVKSWNLSLVLRLPTTGGTVWLKATPPFLGHEGDIIDLVAREQPETVPRLLARDPQRRIILMEDIAGEDQYAATEDVLSQMVRRLVGIQAAWVGRLDELFAVGLPDRRFPAFLDQLERVVQRPSATAALTREERDRLSQVLRRLPARFEAVAACGIPETLLRGDFHPGNWRFDGRSLVLLDWGDSEVGHPLLDVGGFLAWVRDEDVRTRVRSVWSQAWRDAVPGSDPDRAMELVEPLAPLGGAVVYQRFLDNIEADEQRYHDQDVPSCLMAAANDPRLL